MGRTLKRVPLDFAWPLNKVWGGYLNPFYKQRADCPACAASGYAPEAKRFSDQWYGRAPFDPVAYGAEPLTVDHPGVQACARRNVGQSPGYYGDGSRAVAQEAARLFNYWRGQWSHHLSQDDVDALIAADRLWDFTRTPRDAAQWFVVAMKMFAGGNSWLPGSNGYRPTAAEVNAWSLGGFGHDATNQWVCVRARCQRDGVPVECPVCKGSGDMWPSDTIRLAAEEWTPIEPPDGSGFQLWETTSGGSPVSPVFASLEALCEHAAAHCSTFGTSNFVSAERWREMLDADFVHHQDGNHIFV